MSAEAIRLIPAPEEESARAAWIAAPPSELDALKSERLAHGLQNILGMEEEPSVTAMPLTFVSDETVIDPISLSSSKNYDGITQLGGYVGIKIETSPETVDENLAKEIGALLAREYDDSEERTLVSYVGMDTSEIRITGDGFNLAHEITDEHETVDLESVLAKEHEKALKPQQHRLMGKTAVANFFEKFHMPRTAH